MKAAIRRALWGVLAGLLCAANLAYAASPSGEANLLLPQMPLHDPWILANSADRTYYLYTSNVPGMSHTPGVGTMVYRSSDLKHWQAPVAVFLLPQGIWANAGGWAPEVHLYKGHYYIFTTFHNEEKVLAQSPSTSRKTYRRGTVAAVADSPMGPFRLLNHGEPLPPSGFMTLDGTLYVDPEGKPWMVYAHEWLQKLDGTMEAVPLKPDLDGAAGDPVYLFKASDAPWLDEHGSANARENTYVTDGPELFRTKDGHLLMLWSSYDRGSYVETVARSRSGSLSGPWEQLRPLVAGDSGHGMLFHTFDGKLMLVLHRPFRGARGKLYEVRDAGDHLEIQRERTDLDGETTPVLQ